MNRYEVRGDLPCTEYKDKYGNTLKGGPWYIFDNEEQETRVTLLGHSSMLDASMLCDALNAIAD